MLIPDTHPMILLCPSAKAAAADGEVSDGPAPVPASETNVTGVAVTGVNLVFNLDLHLAFTVHCTLCTSTFSSRTELWLEVELNWTEQDYFGWFHFRFWRMLILMLICPSCYNSFSLQPKAFSLQPLIHPQAAAETVEVSDSQPEINVAGVTGQT